MRQLSRIIFLITPAFFIFTFCGCFNNIRYEKYSSKDPELNMAIEHIAGWSHVEQSGSYGSFAQAVFYEPKRRDKRLKAMMVVTAEKSSKVKYDPPTVEGMEKRLLEKRSKFKNARVRSKEKTLILGTEALDILLTYEAIDNIEAMNARIVPVNERIVIFSKNGKFYTLRYENAPEEFNKFNKAFNHLIKTLKFKEVK